MNHLPTEYQWAQYLETPVSDSSNADEPDDEEHPRVRMNLKSIWRGLLRKD